MLSRRALGRATLARQGLLERTSGSVLETIEHLVGMQAQNPRDPHFGLAARLEGYDPATLDALYEGRGVVRMGLMRSTLHLVSAADAWRLGAHMHAVMVRVFGSTPWAKATRAIERDTLVAATRAELASGASTRAELGRRLATRFEAPADALGNAATYLVPMVQIPPRGSWSRTSPATWALVEQWLGIPTIGIPTIDDVVRRYLRAFGPASVADMRTWCGVTDLKAAFARVPELIEVASEDGPLWDLPDAPRPDADTPAPPRLLPEYDNVLLGHADRSRFFGGDILPKGFLGNLLVDGMFAGAWKLTSTKGGGRIEVTAYRTLTKREREAVEAEAQHLLARLHPDLDRSVSVAG